MSAKFTRPRLLIPMVLAMLAATSSRAADDLTPEFIFSTPDNTEIIGSLSDNGRWSLMNGGLYDLSTTPFTRVEEISGSDVSDDGNLIAGSSDGRPAVYDRSRKSWTLLPLPEGGSGGRLQMITGDGHFVLGSVSRPGGSVYTVWNLDDLSFRTAENLPKKDMQNETPEHIGIRSVTPDGRYLLGSIGSQYLLPIHSCSFVVDLETQTYDIIGFKENDRDPYPPEDHDHYGDPCWDAEFPSLLFIENAVMAPDGMIGGTAYIGEPIEGSWFRNEYRCAFRYEPATKRLEILNGPGETDMQCYCMADDGMLFTASPALNPYQFTHIRYGKFYVDLDDLLRQAYGIDLLNLGIQNSGKTLALSGDGSTFLQLYGQDKYYLLKLKEPMSAALARINLLGDNEATPPSGSTMSTIGEITLRFDRDISVSSLSYRSVRITDADGNTQATALQSGGLSAEGKTLHIRFRNFEMEKGRTYNVIIPAGTVWLTDDRSFYNDEITLSYTGRGSQAVNVTSITPEPGTPIPQIDLSDYPLVIYFDSDVKLDPAGSNRALIYSGTDEEPFSSLTLMPATSGDRNRILLAPTGTINLYHGTDYRIVVPAGSICDISGNGSNEEITISYTGTYVMRPAEGNVLFESTCDNYAGWLFYEGDHLTPVAETASMGFNADNYPWMAVRESTNATDMAFGSHSMYYGGGQADDWAVTQQIYVPDNTVFLRFDSQSWRKDKEDRLKVIVYERPNAINLLTSSLIDDIRENGTVVYDELQDPGEDEELLAGEWRDNVVDLGAWEGKFIYICFLNENQNQSMVLIDNVRVERDLKIGLQVTSPASVVDRTGIQVRGNLSVHTPQADFSAVSLRLLDSEGDVVSTFAESGLSLRTDDVFSFTFPDELPLEAGEENRYSIEAELSADDGERLTVGYAGAVRNLMFRPERRVVLEEYTGRDCPNCPRGIRMAELLHERYPDNFIPIALHTYTGDPKGRYVQEYSQFIQCYLVGAPSGRVDRRLISAPMYWDSNREKYVESVRDLTTGDDALLWADEVAAELDEPVFLDIFSHVEGHDDSRIGVVSEIRSAINLEDQNIRVFGVLMEDGITDYQENGLYGLADELLGPWGLGGEYGEAYVFNWTFNHVARSTWGTSCNGTIGLLPATLRAGEEYSVGFYIDVPDNVENVDNCHVAVILIDGNTDRIINAYDCRVAADAVEGVIIEDAEAPAEYYDLQGRRVQNPRGGIFIRRQGARTEKVVL